MRAFSLVIKNYNNQGKGSQNFDVTSYYASGKLYIYICMVYVYFGEVSLANENETNVC